MSDGHDLHRSGSTLRFLNVPKLELRRLARKFSATILVSICSRSLLKNRAGPKEGARVESTWQPALKPAGDSVALKVKTPLRALADYPSAAITSPPGHRRDVLQCVVDRAPCSGVHGRAAVPGTIMK